MTATKGKSLTDILKESDSAPTKRAVEFQPMTDVLQGARPWKMQIAGEFKTGKSRFALSVLKHLYIEEVMDPEEIKFVIIDLDNGVIPLIDQGLVPKELHDSIIYHMCTDFSEVLEATDEAFKILKDHVAKHGLKGAWLMIDNMGLAWEWARDYYSRMVYGKPMRDMLIEAKKRALLQAKQKGKTHGRIPGNPFDQMTDYAIINPLHNDWAESIKNCGFNFVWTALLKYEEIEISGNQRTRVIKAEGQKHNSARVDFMLRKKKDEDTFYGEMVGSRYTSGRFALVKDMGFTKFCEELNKIKEREAEIRHKQWVKAMGRRKAKSKPVPEVTESDEDDLEEPTKETPTEPKTEVEEVEVEVEKSTEVEESTEEETPEEEETEEEQPSEDEEVPKEEEKVKEEDDDDDIW